MPLAESDAASLDIPFRHEVTTQVRLQAGDYVRSRVQQGTGSALNVVKNNELSSEFSMTWLAPGP